MFPVEVVNRRVETLLPMIELTLYLALDGFRAYNGIDQVEQGFRMHDVIIHKNNCG